MAYLGESTPKLGFGLMRLPRLDDAEIDVAQVSNMVDAFIASGCTYFDTARAYPGSEAAIRQALVERYPRDAYTIATKNAAWIGTKTAEEARRDFEISLETLGVDYIDFYLLHNTGDKRTAVFDRLDMWSFLTELKEQGKARHIGFSHHGNAEELEALVQAHPQVEFVQLQISYADWESGGTQSRLCLEVAKKHNLGVVIMEPLRGGLLANPPEPVAKLLKEANPSASYVSWGLRFCFGLPNIITTLSGMSTLEQMQENVGIYTSYEPLTDDEQAVLVKAREVITEMTDNPCTGCHYCMKVCPQDLNIAGIMNALNRKALYGFEHGMKEFFFNTAPGRSASDCLKCGSCEMACPQGISIIQKLEEACEIFDTGERPPSMLSK